MGLGFAKIQLFEKIVENTWGKDKKHFTKDDILYVLQESEDIKKYLTNYKTINRRGYNIFRYFVEYLLYRNLANYDSMVLITSEKGTGKCMHFSDGTDFILASNGEWLRPEKVKNTITLDTENLKLVKTNVKDNYKRIVDKVYKITLQSGKKICLTDNHPLFTIDGWEEVKNLNIGNHIATPRQYNLNNKKTLNKGLIKLIGLLIADGCIIRDISLSSLNKEIREDFLKALKEFDDKNIYGKPTREAIYVKCTGAKPHNAKHIDAKNNTLKKYFIQIGLMNKKSGNKFIPNKIMCLSNKCISILLNRLFSCDGSVEKSKSTSSKRIKNEIYYSSKSELLIRQVQHLLLRFGIYSKIGSCYKCATNTEKKIMRKYWWLRISGRDSVMSFINNIGMIHKLKHERLMILKSNISKQKNKNTNIDIIPGFMKEIYPNWKNNNFNISRHKLQEFFEAGKINHAKNLAYSDILWDKIVNISEIKKENLVVWDLEIEHNSHNFVANDIIIHNSSAALMMAREWCRLLGIKFDPARHIAYSNSDVMAKIDLLNKFEPLVCVVGNTRVKIRHNGKEQTKKIRDLVGMKDYEVLSYNIKEDKFTWETPTRTQFSKRSEIYELELENGKTLRATPDHKVLTKNRRYVELQHLTTDDEVVCEKSKISNPKIIKPNVDLTDVYDIIDVGDNHNFVANGITVKNCDEAIRFACVTGDTKIQLPCNREKYPDGVPIKELEGKRDFYVYSLNTKTNQIELKKSFGCRKTKNDYVYEVELRNGQKIKCTKEHRLLFIDGTYKTVEEIIRQQNKVWFEGGQSRKYIGGWRKALGVRIFNGISNTGYIRYNYNISRPCKMPEHRFIIEQLYDIKLTPNDIVHHDDDNPKNNEIPNLQKVNKKHHNAIHNAPERMKYDSKTYGKNWQNHMRKKALIGDSITLMRKFDGDKAYFQSEEFKTKCVNNKKAHMKRRGQTWSDVYYDTSSKGGKYSYTTKCGMFIKSITKLGKEDVYDILGVEDNGNYIGNNVLLSNSSEEWAKKENKTLKKKLAEVRTKHLLYILCFPLKINKLEKTYLESFTNYWIDLFDRGKGAIYVKDKNPLMDSWRLNSFKKIGSYTEFTSVQAVAEKLKKHPNFWEIIRFPKPSKRLYKRYLKVREHNVYDDTNILANVSKEDIYMALTVLTLKDIMMHDNTLSMSRILLHIKNTYEIDLPKSSLQYIIDDSKQLIKKIKEQAIL